MKKKIALILAAVLIMLSSTVAFADFGDFAGGSDWGGSDFGGGFDSGWDSGWGSGSGFSCSSVGVSWRTAGSGGVFCRAGDRDSAGGISRCSARHPPAINRQKTMRTIRKLRYPFPIKVPPKRHGFVFSITETVEKRNRALQNAVPCRFYVR